MKWGTAAGIHVGDHPFGPGRTAPGCARTSFRPIGHHNVSPMAPGSAGPMTSSRLRLAYMANEPELHPGTCDPWVGYLQQLLQHHHLWSGPVDSEYSDTLLATVRNLQHTHGIPADGVVRADTWAVLTGESTQPAHQGAAPTHPAAHGMTETAAHPHQVPASYSHGGSPAFEYALPQVPIAEVAFDIGTAAVHVTLEMTGTVKVTLPNHVPGVTLSNEGLQLEASQALHGLTQGLQVTGIGTNTPGVACVYGNEYSQTAVFFDGEAMCFRGQCKVHYAWHGQHGPVEVEGTLGYELKVKVVPHPTSEPEPAPVHDEESWYERHAGQIHAAIGAAAVVGLVALVVFQPELLVLAPAAL